MVSAVTVFSWVMLICSQSRIQAFKRHDHPILWVLATSVLLWASLVPLLPIVMIGMVDGDL